MAREGMRVDGAEVAPDAVHWMRCYEGGTLVAKRAVTLVLADMGMRPEESADVAGLPRNIRRLMKNPASVKKLARDLDRMRNTNGEEWRRAIQEVADCWENIWRLHLEWMRADIPEAGATAERGVPEALSNLDMVFFLGLYMPCWIQYGASPRELLIRARSGDQDSVIKLLRLDKNILDDDAVRKAWKDAQYSRNSKIQGDFRNAMYGDPLTRIDIVHVKKVLGALIWRIGQDWGSILRLIELAMKRDGHGRVRLARVELSPIDIRRLFDAIAEDADGGPDRDLLELDDGAWRQGLNRSKKIWPVLPRLM
jgi:hypothetical protein